jgi:Mg2+ and Co2+ transporter CorA
VTKYYDNNNLKNMQIEVENLSIQLKKSSIIPLQVQEKLKTLKTTIANLSKHFTLITNLLNEILDDDEKLSYLNLTLLKSNPSFFDDVENDTVASFREKMSSLFEGYLFDYTNLLFKMNGLNDKIEHEEEYAILKLSLIHNQLMMINMIISILTCVIGFCAYVTGLFGMNLDNVQYIQPVPGVFNGVLISTIVFIPIVTFLVIWILKQNELIPT